jgi:hypothetical protein
MNSDVPFAADASVAGQIKSTSTIRVDGRLRLIVVPVLAVFAVLTAIGIVRTFRPVPFWDDWDGALEFFVNVSEGRWHAWFAQFAEQRPVVPRLFIWADLKFFGGHFIFELLIGLVFALATWATFFVIARSLIEDRAVRFWSVSTVTLLSLSWMQIPNFAIGFNGIHWFLVTFLVLATFSATAAATKHGHAFWLALICGVAAAGTLTNGLIALPLAAVLAYLIGLGMRRAAILFVVGIAIAAAYFTDYVRPAIHGSPVEALSDPIGIVEYTLAYLGSIAFYIVFMALASVELAMRMLAPAQSASLDKLNDHPIAVAAGLGVAEAVGAACVILTMVLGWRWLRSERDPLRGALLMFVILVFGTGLGTSLGRLTVFGIEESIAARYATLILAMLSALLILLAPSFTPRQAAVLFLGSTLLLFPRQLTALRSREAEHAKLLPAMQAVVQNRDTQADRQALGDPEIVERVLTELRAMHPAWQWDLTWYGVTPDKP